MLLALLALAKKEHCQNLFLFLLGKHAAELQRQSPKGVLTALELYLHKSEQVMNILTSKLLLTCWSNSLENPWYRIQQDFSALTNVACLQIIEQQEGNLSQFGRTKIILEDILKPAFVVTVLSLPHQQNIYMEFESDTHRCKLTLWER